MEQGGRFGGSAADPTVRFAVDVVGAVSTFFGSTGHLGDEPVRVLADREMAAQTGPNTGAAYSAENGGVLLWKESSKKTFEAFFKKKYLELEPDEQVQFLSQVKVELMMLVHEAIHAQGPADQEQFEHDYVNGILDDGIRAFKEGITQAAAEAIVDPIAKAMKLDQVDPRILEIATPDVGAYPGQTIAMGMVINGVADDTHRKARDELVDIVRDGCGNLALDRMIRRYVRAQGGRPDVPVIAVIQQAVRRLLGETADEFQQVIQTGSRYGARQMRQIDREARFVAARRGAAIRNGLRQITAQAVREQAQQTRHLSVCRPDRGLAA